MKNKRNILIIDGHNLAYRSLHQPARKHLRCSTGRRSGVFYGFMTDIHRLIQQFKPITTVVVFDTITGAKINKEYEGYKANRKPPKKYLIRQIRDIRKILRYLNVYVLWKDGWEADDLIYATNLFYLSNTHCRTVIVTADHDLLQCLDTRTKVYDDRFKKFWNKKLFKEHYGFASYRLPLYKALAGDRNDGVRGTPGIGKKTAVKLIQEHKWEPRILEHLKGTQQEEFRFSLRAVRLRTSTALQMWIGRKLRRAFSTKSFKIKRSLKLLRKYECRSIVNKFPKWSATFLSPKSLN